MLTNNNESKNWLEWLVFAAGCVLLLGTLACLGYDIWQSRTPRPPLLSVSLGPAQRRGEYFSIPVTVSNAGDETAEGVHVQVVLETSDGQTERSEFQLEFVPKHSTRYGYVLFENDPMRASKLEARPVGFQRP